MEQAVERFERTARKLELAAGSTGLTAAKAVPKRRVKVVFMIRALTVGGAERQLVELAKGLDREVFDVAVLCFYPEGAFVQELLSAGVQVVPLYKRARWEVFRFLLRLAYELRHQRPDILHGYMTGPNLISILMKPILPSTRIVWGMRASNVEMEGVVDRMSSVLEALLSSCASLIIFNSASGQAYCQSSGFAKERCVVIPNGVDLARFSPDRESAVKQRASWGIPTNSLVIGLVGRIHTMKDHPTFLHAAAIVAKSRPDARFVVIGGGPDRYSRELRALAGQLGIPDRIVWTGIIGDMPSAYRALDICCLSSAFGEGTPNVIAEAMACGVPCVVTDVGDSRIVVGETGIVVPPKDPEALAGGLATMAERIAQEPELCQAVRACIESRFSLSMLVNKTSEALLRLS